MPKPTGPAQMRIFLLPKSDYTVKDTWQTVGMRGTGSNTVVDMLMDVSGTSGFSMSTMAQQAWRDVNFAAAHQGLNSRTWGAHYGRIALDVDAASLPMFF